MAMRRDAENVPQQAGEHLLSLIEELTTQGLTGYGGAHAHDDRERVKPCPAVVTTKFRYEPPKLVNLSGEPSAAGTCCSNGSTAGEYDCAAGACAGSYCEPGSTASWVCQTGTSAIPKCCTGNTPGSFCNCQDGNCASRPSGGCGVGGTMCYGGSYAGQYDPSC
jgi:hypothetical protein